MNQNQPNEGTQEQPKLHVDMDWKAQARAEKERLAAKEREQAGQAGKPGTPGAPGQGRQGELPDADFRSLVGLLASQALMGLGVMQDPQSKGVIVDLEGSRFNIDLLGVLEEKTEGNLSDDEAKEMREVLGELRTRYVQIAQAVAQQGAGAQGAAGGAQSGMPGSTSPLGAPGSPGPSGTPGSIPFPGASR